MTTQENTTEIKKSKLDKVINGFEWFSNKIGQQRHLAALKDSLMFIMPLIIVGAVSVLFVTIIFGGWSSEKASLLGLIWMASHGSTEVVFTGAWKEISDFGTNVFGAVKSAGIGTMSLFISFFIGYFIGTSRGVDKPLYVAIASLTSFLIMTKFNWGAFMGAEGMFTAIIVALFASELFSYLQKVKFLQIKLPSSVPPMVGKAFSVLIPFFLTLSIFGFLEGIIILACHLSNYDIVVVNTQSITADQIHNSGLPLVAGQSIAQADASQLLTVAGVTVDPRFAHSVVAEWTGPIIKVNYNVVGTAAADMNLAALIYHFLTLPIINLAGGNGGLGLGILHQFLCAFFFFFGIHGSNLTSGIFDPIWLQTQSENVAVLQAGGIPPHIFTQAFFWTFANLGGTGSTLSLIVVVLCISKNKTHLEVSKFALPAGIFQVNEPVTYGFPIVANPVLAIPFVLSPIFTVTIAWLFMGPMGIVGKPIVLMPWTMPNIIGAPIATRDWRAIFITLTQFAVTLALYLPAVLIDNKINGDKDQKTLVGRISEKLKAKKAAVKK